MKKTTITLAVITATMALFGLYQSNVLALGQASNNFASAISDIQAGATTANPEGPTVDRAIQVGVNIFSVMVGVASVIMIIYGGFKYVTSGGDANSITVAKRTITYAIIGLVIALLSQVIMKLVASKVSGI